MPKVKFTVSDMVTDKEMKKFLKRIAKEIEQAQDHFSYDPDFRGNSVRHFEVIVRELYND